MYLVFGIFTFVERRIRTIYKLDFSYGVCVRLIFVHMAKLSIETERDNELNASIDLKFLELTIRL